MKLRPASRLRPHALQATLCLVAFLAALPAPALEQVSARIDPLQPQLGREFRVVLTGQAAGPVESLGVEFGAGQFGGEELEITIREVGCPEPCDATPFTLQVPIGSLPFEEQELYLLKVRDADADEIVFDSYFAMGTTFFHVLRPEVRLDPIQPTDNDSVQLLIPTSANVCGPSSPEVESIERSGKSLRIFLGYSSGFGPVAQASSGVPAKCTPPVPYLDALAIDLGRLDAGRYSYEIYLQEVNGGTLPIRTNRGNFDVADAPDVVSLQDGRFEVRTEWTDFEGASGSGQPVPRSADDSALFTFFDRDNWEVLVKVLDGCAVDGHYWVFTAAATTVEYTITVTDTLTGEQRTYENPLGVQSPAVTDTSAFSCSE